MYAIIKAGGKQHRVAVGDRIEIDQVLPNPVGEDVTLADVLLVSGDDQFKAGADDVQGAQVIATVLGTGKGRKVMNMDYRNKHRRRTIRGHRQHVTRLQIKEIRI